MHMRLVPPAARPFLHHVAYSCGYPSDNSWYPDPQLIQYMSDIVSMLYRGARYCPINNPAETQAYATPWQTSHPGKRGLSPQHRERSTHRSGTLRSWLTVIRSMLLILWSLFPRKTRHGRTQERGGGRGESRFPQVLLSHDVIAIRQ